MRGHTAPIGGGLMTLGVTGVGVLATVASTSDRASGDWQKIWFLALVSFCGLVAFAGLYTIFAGAFHQLPPRSWTTIQQAQGPTPTAPAIFPDVEFRIQGMGFRTITE